MAATSVLFMGRKDDPFSQDILSQLKVHDTEVIDIYADGLGSRLPIGIEEWTGDFIFCYRSHFILPPKLLRRAKVAAVNFHPGPPEYRGTGCVNMALYDEVTSYGVTAHLMEEEIDAGALLDVRRFSITDEDNVESVLTTAYQHGVEQARFVVNELLAHKGIGLERLIANASNDSWAGPLNKKADLEKLYEVTEGVSKRELNRIIRATKIGDWKPHIKIHGRKFFLGD